MIGFIDDYRGAYGVEPICRVLKIAPSTYHAHDARRRRPDTAPPRVQRDAALCVEIRRVFDQNFQVYGVRKVWRQLVREGEDVARCTVARLMRGMGLQGVIRGRRVRTTISDKAASGPLDRVNFCTEWMKKFRPQGVNDLDEWQSEVNLALAELRHKRLGSVALAGCGFVGGAIV
jgi:transposase InsO family protein